MTAQNQSQSFTKVNNVAMDLVKLLDRYIESSYAVNALRASRENWSDYWNKYPGMFDEIFTKLNAVRAYTETWSSLVFKKNNPDDFNYARYKELIKNWIEFLNSKDANPFAGIVAKGQIPNHPCERLLHATMSTYAFKHGLVLDTFKELLDHKHADRALNEYTLITGRKMEVETVTRGNATTVEFFGELNIQEPNQGNENE